MLAHLKKLNGIFDKNCFSLFMRCASWVVCFEDSPARVHIAELNLHLCTYCKRAETKKVRRDKKNILQTTWSMCLLHISWLENGRAHCQDVERTQNTLVVRLLWISWEQSVAGVFKPVYTKCILHISNASIMHTKFTLYGWGMHASCLEIVCTFRNAHFDQVNSAQCNYCQLGTQCIYFRMHNRILC